MCTLIVATRIWQELPLLVAANRDEKLDRPSRGPQQVVQGGVRFFAPRDLKSGGTWIGVNSHGLFVAITNRYTGAPPKAPRSRGLLVLDALSEDTAAHAMRRVAAETPTRHDPFHLVMADAKEAHLVWNDGARHHHEPLAPGFHIVTERSLAAGASARIPRLRERVQKLFGARPPSTAQLQEVLREHSVEGLEGTCVHAPELDYGTRSSSIIELPVDRARARWLHSDGPPCTHEYVDLGPALRAMLTGA
ncbi:MAG TPA: NRDE family protein [Nannocystaceae bacterium]|nr:NRDE family protein [Nannocystaceae bacterium]